MKRGGRVVLLGALALVTATGLGLMLMRERGADTPSPGAPPSAVDEARARPDADLRAAGAQARRLAEQPLPDAGQPLRLIHEQLRSRATSGDARAACRLAAEFERCDGMREQHRGLQVFIEGHDATLARSDLAEPLRVRLVAEHAAQRARSEELGAALARCEGAPTLSAEARARLWRQAALAGHLPSMRHYASGNAFRHNDLLDALPALQDYRREAEAIAIRAAAHGDIETMRALAVAYSDSGDGRFRTFLAQVVVPDLGHALAWYRLLDTHPDIVALDPQHPLRTAIARGRAGVEAAASPAERESAARLVARYPHAHDRVDDEMPPMRRLAGGAGAVQDLDPVACADTRFAGA
ncbi:hypothetical protein [Luteimonas deserti]|uniref:Sel1 repeat family protein n=1 Tax=Luteimonas deserti TaxID=2752306 RepID=A0A7Z0QNF5_9GAMM|nr:hypothetical protein [Luteimonas deserti]NYZ61857.1 hypothetical protein [Luteimonas deserti]